MSYLKKISAGGPVGSDSRLPEVEWKNGRALQPSHKAGVPLPSPLKLKEVDEDLIKKEELEEPADEGSQTNPLPTSLQEWPMFDDPLPYTNKTKPTRMNRLTNPLPDVFTTERRPYVAKSYLAKWVEAKTKPVFFADFLKTVKLVYPALKMRFPSPPTYVWNPTSEEDQKKLDPNVIKDALKVRLPNLVWVVDFATGLDESEVGFDDGSKAELAIGLDANHLSITYYKSEAKDEVSEETPS